MPVEVLLIGTMHLNNPGLDLANTVVDDCLSPHRQQELAEIAEGLARFSPHKVAVERVHPQPACFSADSVDRSEAYQLGARLAQLMGHHEVLGIDVEDAFFIPEIEAPELQERFAEQWSSLLRLGARSTTEIEARLAVSSFGQVLRHLNSPASRHQDLAPYLDCLLPMAHGDNWSGPDMVANWYRRNFRIAAKLDALVEPEDRVVVIFGAGHAPVLEQIWGAGSKYRLVDPLEFLPFD